MASHYPTRAVMRPTALLLALLALPSAAAARKVKVPMDVGSSLAGKTA